MRYGTESRHSPADVLERARAFFGVDGKLGLPELSSTPDSVTFGSETGGVGVSVAAIDGKTEVTVLSREYDFWAERFTRDLY